MKKDWLLSLLVVSDLYGVPIDPLQMFHELNMSEADDVTQEQLLKMAKYLGYRAKQTAFNLSLTPRYPMPCLLIDKQGNYHVLV